MNDTVVIMFDPILWSKFNSILNQNRITFLLVYRHNLITSESLSGRA